MDADMTFAAEDADAMIDQIVEVLEGTSVQIDTSLTLT
jgi:hypothetical protein